MRLVLEIGGVPEVAAGIEGGYTRMQLAAFNEMRMSMLALRNYTLNTHMHGPTGPNTVQQRSGNLARSTVSQVEDDGNAITGVVGIPDASPATAYARILHDGGSTRAHVIKAAEGKKLAFMASGQMIFRRQVNHPGSNFPARPYLASALEEQAKQIKANLAAAMQDAVK